MPSKYQYAKKISFNNSKKLHYWSFYFLNGVSWETRTPDPLIKSQMLYLLS